MDAASINTIKKELETKSHSALLSCLLRLSRFKKENKELLTFLLFEEENLENYIENMKQEIDELFLEINSSHIYYIKKGLRKILRLINKIARITASKIAEAELLICYCNNVQRLPASVTKNKQVLKIYENQLGKIEKAVAGLHPDLQYDLRQKLPL